MDLSCLVSTVLAGEGGEIVWEMCFWHSFALLIPINHHLNTTAHLSTSVNHVHLFMASIYHLLMPTSSMIMHPVTKQKSS